MGVRVTLDSTLLADTPAGWDKAKITTKMDKTVRGLLSTYTTDLEFWGDGFDYLDNKMNQDYCNVIDILIESDDCEAGNWREEFVGIIQLTQITVYDVTQRVIKTKILDESFDAKIKNNKSLKAFVTVGESKNGENIQAASANNISFFLPSAGYGTYIASTREGFRVFDCFRFIIDYMTDGTVEFKSDIFAGDYYNWMLFNGKEIRQGLGNGYNLEVSFKELFLELNKKTNLSFAIEPTPTSYTNAFRLRLEPTSYFEEEDEILQLDDVNDILLSFNKEQLYSHIEVGSKDFDDNVVLSYPPINFKAFKEENYTILGQCNIDKPLDLVSKFIIDTNVLELLLTTGSSSTTYDKKTFLVVTDGTNCIKYKEYDAPVSEGVDDAGAANKLTDSTADFNADGVVSGDMAVNMLTNLKTNIISVDAGGTFCTLTDDIFNNGDDYQIRDAPFSYNHPLTNIEVVKRFIGGLPNSVIKQYSLSASSNFYAGITTDVTKTTFPATINPISYDDDSTPPFFDDGGNYTSINHYYTVPVSGLYGFEANAVIRLNGQLGSDEITNGDFTASTLGTGSVGGANSWTWFGTVFEGIENGTSGRRWFSDQTGYSTFLKQYLTILPNTIYILTFESPAASIGADTKVNGFPIVSSNGDIHTIILDYSNNTNPIQYIEFKFPNYISTSVDNVILQPTPTFYITQTIQRISSLGVLLQSFPTVDRINFLNGEFQREIVLNAQETFSTFAGERINVIMDITNPKGSSTQVKLLSSLFNQTTQLTDRTDFKTILIDDGGGDLLPVDPSTFPIYKYRFKKGLTFDEFKALRDAPEKAILFSKNKLNHLFAWRNKITYDRETGLTNFEVRSKTKIIGDC